MTRIRILKLLLSVWGFVGKVTIFPPLLTCSTPGSNHALVYKPGNWRDPTQTTTLTLAGFVAFFLVNLYLIFSLPICALLATPLYALYVFNEFAFCIFVHSLSFAFVLVLPFLLILLVTFSSLHIYSLLIVFSQTDR